VLKNCNDCSKKEICKIFSSLEYLADNEIFDIVEPVENDSASGIFMNKLYILFGENCKHYERS
jgi:hypothetical protein